MARLGLGQGAIGVKKARRVYARVMGLVLLAGGAAYAYDGPGHHLATLAAVAGLPEEMPAFFRAAAPAIANGSMDPDVFKLEQLPQLRNAEYPEHYFDMELLKGRTPPPLRYAFLDLCAKEGLAPSRVGTLPYAVTEWTQRLTVAFAELRRWPDNMRLRQKCIVYAGILSHYAEDATQPLHVTIDYDGRALAGGKSPRSGIHAKVDALIQKVPGELGDPGEVAGRIRPEAFDDLWSAVLAQLNRSHALVDRTYDLEPLLPGRQDPLPDDVKVVEFARDRLEAAAWFTASLYLTAWRDSERLGLPDWHIRERPASEAQAVASRPASQPTAR
jgi:hypothetical protein